MTSTQLMDQFPGGEGAVYGSSFTTLGPRSAATVASGVLTVTTCHVNVTGEGGNDDTVDSIVFAAAMPGTLLLLVSDAGDTITYDDAAIKLGAATRACAPGGSLLLVMDAARVWTEISFTASGDHA